jgi:alpha-L-arabinofuranosidase
VTSFDRFARVAIQTSVQVFITANYGTGTAREAADWVHYSNVTRKYGFKYWEIGNENYGSWEADTQVRPHDPYTYATRAKDYYEQMKAVDPSIRVGVVVLPGEDIYLDAYNDHPAVNPRTGATHLGWTPVVLSTLRSLGVIPDFAIYHRYIQQPGMESDFRLLQSTRIWANDVKDLRQQLADYLGPDNTKVELVCTEYNSASTYPGKQTTSLVNALFLADSVGLALQTELNAFLWWDLRNSRETGNNNDPALYGWRNYGDYGMVFGAAQCYPTFYVSTLLKYFARGGDQVVQASSDSVLLSVYAAHRSNGSLTLLLVNKSPSGQAKSEIRLKGFQPRADAKMYSYGMPQDEAARTGRGSPDLVQTPIACEAAGLTCTLAPYSVAVVVLAPAAE